MSNEYRAGFLGLVGYPNAGKSSLMNALIEEKVSIVSRKPQTTRRRVLGIHSSPEGQIVFVDSPGLVKTQKGLNSFIAREAQGVIDDSDALVAVLATDAETMDEAEDTLRWVTASGKPWFAVITKSDLADKAHRVRILSERVETAGGRVLTIASTAKPEDNKEAREEILAASRALLPVTPQPLYDVELFTSETERTLVAEIIREKCFELLHQEVPFGTAVLIQKFDEAATPLRIYAEILVSRTSHKAIVIGEGGQMIKKIGTAARADIEKLLDGQVFLQLNVAVRENWFENKSLLKELGYVHND